MHFAKIFASKVASMNSPQRGPPLYLFAKR